MSLVVQDLSKKYGTRTVVDHLSFEMNRPGVLCTSWNKWMPEKRLLSA